MKERASESRDPAPSTDEEPPRHSGSEMLTGIKAELSDRDRRIFSLETALAERETEIRSLEETLSALYASTSWKISVPLRLAKRLLARMRYFPRVQPARPRQPDLRHPTARPVLRVEEEDSRAADYSAWEGSRRAARLEAADDLSGLWNHLITIVIFAAEPDGAMRLSATLASLRRQHYRNIEVLLAGVPSDLPADLTDFSEYRGLFVEPALHPLDVLTLPAVDRLWRGSHLMFARAGTEFAPDAFALFNAALNAARGDAAPDLVLCDHDRLTASGEVTAPILGPGWDPDLICAFDYIETAFLASRALVLTQRAAQPPASLHQWLCGVARGLRQPATGHVAEPLVHMRASAPRPALQPAAPAVPWTAAGAELPALAIVVPNRNKPELLKRCTRFLEFPNRFRPELVVVDNASDEPAVSAIYRDLCARHGARIVQMNQPFNFSRMVNLGVAAATAEVVLLLNNDVEITAPGLLEQMLAHALRPEVGVVGSKLLYPDGTVQHAGMMLSPGPTPENCVRAKHVLRGAPGTADGYLYQLRTVRNYQCVTGALLAMRREVFEHVGGFDEVALPVEYGDVDFCLRVRRAGRRVIALPLDGAVHAESSTRGTASPPAVMDMRTAAMAVIAERWPGAIAHDPYRNPWVAVGEVAEARFPWSGHARSLPRRAIGPATVPSASTDGRHHRRSAELPLRLEDGLCITGYLRSEIGLGQAARSLAHACDTQRLPLSFRSLPLPRAENEQDFATKCNQIRNRKANLLVVGLPAIRDLQSEIGGGVMNILYPFWELSRVPAEWLTLVRRFDEVWAPSTFVASTFPDRLGRPVRLVRQPMRLPPAAPPPRSGREALRLFTYLDFDSYGARKNPTAAVNAFQAAFGSAQRDVELVVKTRGTDDRGLRQWLLRAAAADRRIKVIDRTVDRMRMNELMASCDAFVSLHRSEGFGFGAAEALAAGKAVVATDYGGTTDFITPETGYPVDYVLEPVQPGQYVACEGQVWASARQEAAVAALRSIYRDPAAADARALRGFALLRAQNALPVVGAGITRLLRDLGVL